MTRLTVDHTVAEDPGTLSPVYDYGANIVFSIDRGGAT